MLEYVFYYIEGMKWTREMRRWDGGGGGAEGRGKGGEGLGEVGGSIQKSSRARQAQF